MTAPATTIASASRAERSSSTAAVTSSSAARSRSRIRFLSCAHEKEWCAEGWQLFSNGGAFQPAGTTYFPTVPGMPQTFFTTDRRVNQSSYNGVIYNAGLQATTNGTGVMPFQIGQYGRASPFGAEVGGDGRRAYEDTTLMPETERSNLMASLSYDFTETLSGTFDLSFANVQGLNLQNDAYFYAVDNYCIGPNNAYTVNNPALQAAVASNVGNGTFFFCPGQTLVRKDFTDYATRSADTDSDTWRVIAGLDGSIGDSSWTWEGSFQLGQTKRDQIGRNYPSVYRYQMAIDAVINPATGQPACRVTVQGAERAAAVRRSESCRRLRAHQHFRPPTADRRAGRVCLGSDRRVQHDRSGGPVGLGVGRALEGLRVRAVGGRVRRRDPQRRAAERRQRGNSGSAAHRHRRPVRRRLRRHRRRHGGVLGARAAAARPTSPARSCCRSTPRIAALRTKRRIPIAAKALPSRTSTAGRSR